MVPPAFAKLSISSRRGAKPSSWMPSAKPFWASRTPSTLRNTSDSLPEPTAALATTKPTVALSVLSLAWVMLTQNLLAMTQSSLRWMRYTGCSMPTSVWPVMRHHAGMSAGAPGSRAMSRKSSPGPKAERRKRSSSTSSPQPSSPASHWAATLATRSASGRRHAALVDLLEGARIEAPRRRIVEDATVAQGDDTVRVVASEADLVKARDDRDPLGGHRAERVEHAGGRLGIEARHGLVRQDHRRLLCEGARDGDPLLLPTREPIRPAIGLVEEADGVEAPERLLTIRLHEAAGEDPPRRHGGEAASQHVLDAAQPANEVELLEDHGDLAPRRAEIAPAEAADVASVDLDHAPIGSDEPGEAAEERGLARAAWTQNADELARRDLEGHLAECFHAARISLGEAGHAHERAIGRATQGVASATRSQRRSR